MIESCIRCAHKELHTQKEVAIWNSPTNFGENHDFIEPIKKNMRCFSCA